MMGEQNVMLFVALLIAVTVDLSTGHSIKEPGPLTASFSRSSSSASAFSHASSSSYSFNGNVNPNDVNGLNEAVKAQAAASASAGAFAGVGSGAGATAQAGAVAGSSASKAGSAGVAGGNSGADSGGSPGCSHGNSCGTGQDSNAIAIDNASYKGIESDKYKTGYPSGSQTNYAVSSNYVQGSQNTAGNCASCKGPFPGPNGSIHDYKLASSVPKRPSVQPSAAISGAHSGAGAIASPAIKNEFPGSSGNIYSSKPAVAPSGSSGGQYHGSGHVSPSLIASLPGAAGSIYDSKPVGAVSGAAAHAGAAAGAASFAVGGGSHPAPTFQQTPSGASPGLTQIISVLPGSSGSIYDSKPAKNTGSGSSSGSVVNIPSSDPGVGPACSYTPGSPNSCGSPVPTHVGATAGANAASQAGAGAINFGTSHHGSQTGAGSVANIPSTHPVVGPACSHTPGSSNKCGPGSVTNIPSTHPVVGPVCSYAPGSPNKCGSGSVTNIPSTHPVVGPVCSYTPGSPNKCGAPVSEGDTQYHTGAAGSGAGEGAQGGAEAPSIHPQVPSSGTYYINKPSSPSVNVEPPHVSNAPSFSGQIPCSGSSCGTIPKAPQQDGGCGGFGSGCGAQAGSHGGTYSGSGVIVYEDRDKSDYYQSLNHDKAHLSGGFVYENDDGTYNNVPTTTGKPAYKNAANGGHAVSSNSADNTGFLIGPGTGHLPIEADAKPFGTQGAFGGSAAFAKGAAQKDAKPFGTQGAFGGSAAFSHGSATQSKSDAQGSAGGEVSIQKVDGIEVNQATTTCTSSACTESGSSPVGFGHSGSANGEEGFATGQVVVNKGGTVYDITKESGGSLGAAGQVLVNKESGGTYDVTNYGSRSGSYTGSSGAGQGGSSGHDVTNSGAGGSSGFATGQVLVNKGGSTYDVTNSGSGSHGTGHGGSSAHDSAGSGSGFATGQVLVNKGGSTYDVTNSGSAGTYSGGSGCGTGFCGGNGFAVGGSFALPSPGGFLNKLFGAGGLSGAGGSSAAGYSGVSSGSFASAGASASAHAGSFASSF